MGGAPFLTTARLDLRALEKDDAEALFAIFADEETMRFDWNPVMRTLDEAHEMIARAIERAPGDLGRRWVLIERASRTLVGMCTLTNLSRPHDRCEIGYVLERSRWGAGLMTEALEAVLVHAFDGLALHRVEAELDPRNARSVRLLERLGFAREGLMRGRYFVNDEVCDALWMGLLEPAWRARNAGAAATAVDVSLRPVGTIRSPLKTRAEAPKQGNEGAPDAWIEIEPWAAEALLRVNVGDALIVLTWLDRARRDVMQVHPRSDHTNSLHGVFATRSPDRPNPIGLHPVTVRAIEGTRLLVGPIEAIDGTPVVDLKPDRC